jgi:CTD small phosphatase-like protein 2
LPDIKEGFEFTLVLDLDETLIHYIESSVHSGENGHFLIRPGAREFLNKMNEHYEIVIFTAAVQDYADWVID